MPVPTSSPAHAAVVVFAGLVTDLPIAPGRASPFNSAASLPNTSPAIAAGARVWRMPST